ncbi:hypothetical protein KBD81_03925 [Candidatus Woesebacteria bacterium]|nr:hypothetical protein [Candidatus Woesebacteria bacterium]
MIIPVQTRSPLYFFPKNTSTKQIEEKLMKDRQLRIRIVSVASVLPAIILWYLTNTEMKNLFETVGKSMPLSIELAPFISIIAGGIMYYILSRLSTQTPKYGSFPTNEGGIGVSVIPDTKTDLKIMLTVFVLMGIILSLFLGPILTITK